MASAVAITAGITPAPGWPDAARCPSSRSSMEAIAELAKAAPGTGKRSPENQQAAGPLPPAWGAALRAAGAPVVPCPATAEPMRSKTARIAAERTDFCGVCTLKAKVARASATVMRTLSRGNVARDHRNGQEFYPLCGKIIY